MHDNYPAAINLEIYQLDVYRLLVLLLADKTVAKSKQFNPLGDKFTEGEVNRLLTMIAAFSRQLLDDENKDNEEFAVVQCGEYRRHRGQSKPLTFRGACNQIIHAKGILLYKAPLRESMNSVKYFERIITITGQDKQSVPVVSELDFLIFAEVCVKMSTDSG